MFELFNLGGLTRQTGLNSSNWPGRKKIGKVENQLIGGDKNRIVQIRTRVSFTDGIAMPRTMLGDL